MIWHHETPQAVMEELGCDSTRGLSREEAAARLAEDGENRYFEKKPIRLAEQLGKQMKSIPTLLTVLAALWLLCVNILTLYYGGQASLLPPIIALLLLPIGHLICALWQKRAMSHLHRLQNAQNGTVQVKRDGEWTELSVAQVVRGDLIRLEAGMILPADCRLIESEDLFCDECVLTGEETDVAKAADRLLDGITPMLDRVNMVYAGCGVLRGSGTAVVVSTAFSTEYAIQSNQSDNGSPLPVVDKDILSIEKLTTVPVLVLSLIVLVVGMLCTGSIIDTVAPSLMLAAVMMPACLSVAAVIAMAMGMHHVVTRSADLRELSVMDTLSRVSVICADKTGILTTDEKKPVSVYIGGEPETLGRFPSERAQTLFRLATLCTASDTQKTGKDNHLIGNPTEAAIIEYARDIGLERRTLMEESPRLSEIPFDSERRCMSVVHLVAGHKLMISMGAPETVLGFCSVGSLEEAEKINHRFGSQALRVLAIAYKYVDDVSPDEFDADQESGMTFGGLIALADQPREESIHAIAACARGGITTVMLTGDNPATAAAVARQLGILHDEGELLTGEQLAELSDEELRRTIQNYRVFARITPENKPRILRAWQARGAVVAVTGSTLADVPALQAADVGCATGIADCDMTRSASDLTLYDNSFGSLADVIKQARGIYANIRKALQYTLSCSVGLLAATLLTLLTCQHYVLSVPSMMLFWLIGLVSTMAIAYESADRHSLAHRPRRGIGRLMPPSAWMDMLWQGALVGLCGFLAYDIGQSGAADESGFAVYGLTTAFITLMMARLWLMLAVRGADSGHKRAANRVMPLVFVLGFILTALICVVPAIGTLFGVAPVSPSNWLLSLILSLIPAVATVVVRIIRHMLSTVKAAEPTTAN